MISGIRYRVTGTEAEAEMEMEGGEVSQLRPDVHRESKNKVDAQGQGEGMRFRRPSRRQGPITSKVNGSRRAEAARGQASSAPGCAQGCGRGASMRGAALGEATLVGWR